MKNQANQKILTDVASAASAIDDFDGPPQEFMLALAEEIHDAIGINIAVITDHALKRGWFPAGFEQRDGYRLYRYANEGDAES